MKTERGSSKKNIKRKTDGRVSQQKNYCAFNLAQHKQVSDTYSEDLPLASPTFRSKEFLVAQLTIQGSLLLYKPNVGHCIFAVRTVKFFWMPRFPQCH